MWICWICDTGLVGWTGVAGSISSRSRGDCDWGAERTSAGIVACARLGETSPGVASVTPGDWDITGGLLCWKFDRIKVVSSVVIGVGHPYNTPRFPEGDLFVSLDSNDLPSHHIMGTIIRGRRMGLPTVDAERRLVTRSMAGLRASPAVFSFAATLVHSMAKLLALFAAHQSRTVGVGDDTLE